MIKDAQVFKVSLFEPSICKNYDVAKVIEHFVEHYLRANPACSACQSCVNIDNKLNFKQHVQEKCKRATTVLNMLKRNLYFAPKSVKCKAYQATVLPILEYASNCWSPTSQKQNNSLEMVQHNAAKFVSIFHPKKGNYDNFQLAKF